MSTRRQKVIAIAFDGTPVETFAPIAASRRRRNWFGRFVLALKLSRQRAARRELARYAHLIDLERRYGDLTPPRDNLPFG
jgi:hypothetical protein